MMDRRWPDLLYQSSLFRCGWRGKRSPWRAKLRRAAGKATLERRGD